MGSYAKYWSILTVCLLFGVTYNMAQMMLSNPQVMNPNVPVLIPNYETTIIRQQVVPYGVGQQQTGVLNGGYGNTQQGTAYSGLPYNRRRRYIETVGEPAEVMPVMPVDTIDTNPVVDTNPDVVDTNPVIDTNPVVDTNPGGYYEKKKRSV